MYTLLFYTVLIISTYIYRCVPKVSEPRTLDSRQPAGSLDLSDSEIGEEVINILIYLP